MSHPIPPDDTGLTHAADTGRTDTGRTHTADGRSLGEVVGALTTDLSTLFKQELDLAKVELKQEMGRAGKGAGLLGGAAVSGLLLLVFASLTLMFLLDNWMPIELAALIVTALWGIAAAVMALTGRGAIKESNPQLPKTQQTLKEDAQWAKTRNS